MTRRTRPRLRFLRPTRGSIAGGKAAPKRAVRVAIIGGGFGGIAAAVKLQKSGITDFVVFERSPGLGGTWWDNRYPGAQTDAASHMYCYSFARYDWSRTHVGHTELRDYLEYVVDKFDLRRHFRVEQHVTSVMWDDSAAQYEITTADGATHRFEAVISAVGMFNAPQKPALPGLGSFAGTVIHTASWDDRVTLDGLRIAVVGTGSSATQVVPALAGRAERVVVFQRQAGWLLPKGDRDFTRLERRIYRLPLLWRLNRLRLYLRQERREFRGAFFRPGTGPNRRAQKAALAHIADVFADRPDLQTAVTPTFPFGGKRAVLSSTFYRSLLRDDVELVPHAVVSCTPTGVVDATGVERKVDALVLATGFRAAEYLSGLQVVGRGGVDLHRYWNGEPSAFLGITVPAFPNFFMLYGPNTNGGFIISNLERQAAFAAKDISLPRDPNTNTVEVRADLTDRYNHWLQRKITATAFAATQNYFQSASGKVVTQWPDTATLYAVLTLLLRRISSRRSVTGSSASPSDHQQEDSHGRRATAAHG